MGLDQTVMIPKGQPLAYPDLAGLLAGRGLSIQLRMIDGELAFPDEIPPPAWNELRVNAAGEMVTMQRREDRVVLVIWSNATPELTKARNALAWACAAITGGRVVADAGSLAADEFLANADLPAGFQRSNPNT